MSSYQSAAVVIRSKPSSAKALNGKLNSGLKPNWKSIYLSRVDLKAKSRKHTTPLSPAPDPQAEQLYESNPQDLPADLEPRQAKEGTTARKKSDNVLILPHSSFASSLSHNFMVARADGTFWFMISIIKNSKVQFEFGSRHVRGARGRPTRVCYCSRARKGLKSRRLPHVF